MDAEGIADPLQHAVIHEIGLRIACEGRMPLELLQDDPEKVQLPRRKSWQGIDYRLDFVLVCQPSPLRRGGFVTRFAQRVESQLFSEDAKRIREIPRLRRPGAEALAVGRGAANPGRGRGVLVA